MTSDRVSSGGAELQLNNTPVTQKSPGLNPNATVFFSKTQDANNWDEIADGNYQFANGDINKLDQSGGFPLAPESPLQSDFQSATEGPNQQLLFSPENVVEDENSPLEGTVPDDQLRQLLKTQLEYYFSRENLTTDTYLMSQMDADQYVPISAVAGFSQVQRLTHNRDLVVDVLRECQNVQVDDKGEKVRPNHNRCIVILREIPESTPIGDVEQLFLGTNCPKFVSCEFAHNDNWYVTFDSDGDAQLAYRYLREEVKTFLGKPIMARIKAKPLIRSTYVPRNGMKPQYEQQTFTATPQRYTFVPNIQYNQQPFPFYPSPVLPSWPTAGPTIMDPSMVFAMNGYQATSVKINPSGRHGFQNMRLSRSQKPHRLNQERASSDSRLVHDRHQAPSSAHRASPRSVDSSQLTTSLFHSRKGDNSNSHTAHLVHAVSHPVGGSDSSPNLTLSRQSDASKDLPPPLPQRKGYKSRRKRDDDSVKNSKQNSQVPTSTRAIEPQFEFESTSFPPLPGSQNNSATGEIFENKLSDVVRGTAKLQVKEIIPAPAPPSPVTKEVIVSQSSAAPTTISSTPPIVPPSTPMAVVTTPPVSPQKMPAKDQASIEPIRVAEQPPPPPKEDPVAVLPPPPPPPPPPQPQPQSQSQSQSHLQPQPQPHSQSQPRQISVQSQPAPPTPSCDSSTSVAPVMVLPPIVRKVEDKPVSKLSYAQMVQKRKEPDPADKSKQPQCEQPAHGTSLQTAVRSQALKEQSQSQSIRVSPPASRLSSKDQLYEPKEQRFNSGRRAKENRERREKRRDRDRTGPRK